MVIDFCGIILRRRNESVQFPQWRQLLFHRSKVFLFLVSLSSDCSRPYRDMNGLASGSGRVKQERERKKESERRWRISLSLRESSAVALRLTAPSSAQLCDYEYNLKSYLINVRNFFLFRSVSRMWPSA